MFETFVVLTIVVALLFDFINGFHDSANAIATVVATRVLSPIKAVAMAGAFNFIGPFLFSLAVSNTVATGFLKSNTAVPVQFYLATLMGAIVWNLITWRLGLPSSSSHALTGGILGAAVAAVGSAKVKWITLTEAQFI